MTDNISLSAFKRLPEYLHYLKGVDLQKMQTVSSTLIANALRLGEVQVRKDLSAICKGGKPKVGYKRLELIESIEDALGFNEPKDVILVGAGKLGQALLGFGGFDDYGFNIVAGFDSADEMIDKEVSGKKILPMGKVESLVEKLGIKYAILTVPSKSAQVVAEYLVKCGIKAIWNFTQVKLNLPIEISVRNENMAASLAVLVRQYTFENTNK